VSKVPADTGCQQSTSYPHARSPPTIVFYSTCII
jgi:hypothetical protein